MKIGTYLTTVFPFMDFVEAMYVRVFKSVSNVFNSKYCNSLLTKLFKRKTSDF